MTRRPTALLLLAAMALNGCSQNWQPIAVPQPKPLDPGQVIEFRVRDTLIRLHGVQFSRDSVSGIPWLEHLSCDTCRVGYALAEMSQARSGNPGAPAWWLLGPVVAVVGFGVLLFLALLGYHGD